MIELTIDDLGTSIFTREEADAADCAPRLERVVDPQGGLTCQSTRWSRGR